MNLKRYSELFKLAFSAISVQRTRSALTLLGISIGIFAVVLLTSIGEGIHRFVLAEFTQFGSNIVAINPGKATTHGGSIGVFGSVRPLSIQDAEALRRVPNVTAVVSAVQGNVEVESHDRQRRVTVYGVSSEFDVAFTFKPMSGRFLPADDPLAPRSYAVLGYKLKAELFGDRNPLGERIRIGGDRYRVIGVMESKGQILGFDLDDTVYIPAAKALEMFNREGLMEVDVVYRESANIDEVVSGITRILTARHGKDDFTITTQQQMLDVLGSILDIFTFAVAALGGISLIVGAVGIISIMLIALQERTREIGLYRALGARRITVEVLFLNEAVILAAAGGILGLIFGLASVFLLQWGLPQLPVHVSWTYVILAEAIAIMIGLLAGVYPAYCAARLDPVEALRSE